MYFLPPFTSLDQLELIEAYEFYDHQPILFACQNPTNKLFMAVWVDEEELFDTWLYVRMSPRKFEHVRSGLIDLHDTFARPSDGYVFVVDIPHDEQQQISIRRIASHLISEEWLPLAGEFLNLETITVPELDYELPKQAKEESWQKIMMPATASILRAMAPS